MLRTILQRVFQGLIVIALMSFVVYMLNVMTVLQIRRFTPEPAVT